MPLVPGATATEGLQSTQRRINLHRLQGGSAASRLQSGLELRITSLDVSAASADVKVVVTNTGVGHAAPGGLSSKSLVLAVGVDAGTSELMHRCRAEDDAGGRRAARTGPLKRSARYR